MKLNMPQLEISINFFFSLLQGGDCHFTISSTTKEKILYLKKKKNIT